MTLEFWQKPLSLVFGIGVTPDDDERTRMEKAILVGTALMVSVAAILWGLVYLLFGEPLAASIPLLYAVFSLLYIGILGITYRYRFFRSAQLVLTLLLPFLLMLVLGGYINGSAVIVWSFVAPVGALLGGRQRQALLLFVAYLALVSVAGLAQPVLRTQNNLPGWLIIVFFAINVGTVSAITYVVLLYFVRQKDLAMQLMRKNRELEQSYLQQEIMLRQSEKLATLGKLSAGMAHELNNPAAAAQRGSGQLRDGITQLRRLQFELGASNLSEPQLDVLAALGQRAAGGRLAMQSLCDPRASGGDWAGYRADRRDCQGSEILYLS